MMIRAFLTTTLLLSTLAISACGMRPVYGTYAADPAMKANLASVSISPVPDRLGQDLRNQLIDIMYQNGYPGAGAPYTLNITPIKLRKRSLGIAKDASTTRSQVSLFSKITLIETATKTTLLTRNIQSTSSYNVLPSQYTTQVAAHAASTNASLDMANQIVTALELYFSNPSAFIDQPDQPAPDMQDDDLQTMVLSHPDYNQQ